MKSSEATRERVLSLIDSEYDSDAAFEREMNLQSKTVNNWRRGRSASYMKMLPALAAAFDISVSELLNIPVTGECADLSEDEAALINNFRKARVLSAKQRIALAKSIENIINLYVDSAPDKKKTSN